MMNQLHHHEFDPFSEESSKVVENVESLPFSQAFEHMLYAHRLDRIVSFEYDRVSGPNVDYNPTPFVIDSDVMMTRFPAAMRGIFPEDEYTIEELQIKQIEHGFDDAIDIIPTTQLFMSFKTHMGDHYISIENGVATYQTRNDALDETSYTFEPEAIIGFIAALVYAKQYDPAHPGKAIELAESTLSAPRDPKVDFVEQLIMTLGNFSGHSTLETRAMFENPSGPPLIATLREQEFPDKSVVSNKLILSEVTEVNERPTSTETQLTQNIVNVEEGTSDHIKGRLAKHYAEQRSTVFATTSLTTSQYIDPKVNYPRWVLTCQSFLKSIETPMEAFSELDGPAVLD